MDRSELLTFLRSHKLCVQASADAAGEPQCAVVGYAVTGDLEIVFDTLSTTRKIANLRKNRRVALVVGWDDERTVQMQGVADEPKGEALAALKKAYFAVFPDGPSREGWPDITYVRVRLTWARYSDFRPGGGVHVIALDLPPSS